jgi:N-methylhydantoinase A
MTLNTEAAHNALQPLAERLGYTIEHTALGIIGIVVANMVRALRTVSVERGHDPRGFVLMPFGGAGPLHASEVARSLGMTRVLVPRNPGILCAQGLLVSDLQENFVRTVVSPVNDDTHDLLLQTVKDLRAEADAWFTTESIAPIKREARLTLDMRYIGQNFELPVALPGGTDDPLPGPMELASLFFRAHDQNYGFFNPDDSIEVVNVRLAARGRQRRTDPRPVASTSEPARPSLARPVWFTSDRPTETPVFRRDRLLPAQTITGPAVIEQLDATTLLLPGDRASIDADLNLIVDILP